MAIKTPYTAQDVIVDALSLCGAVAMDEVPGNTELNLGLRIFNQMLGFFATQRFMIRATSLVSFSTTAGKASYTIGASGADVTSSKPVIITSAFITDSSQTDYNLDVIEKSLYDSQTDKNIAWTRPYLLAYDPGLSQQATQKGTIWLYNTPDTVYTVKVECILNLVEIASLSETLTFELPYYEMLVGNLAIRVFRHFHPPSLPIPQDLVDNANKTLKAIKSMNSVRVNARIDIPGVGGAYNVYTDEAV